MFAYNESEAAFISGIVDEMHALDYMMLSGAHVTADDVPCFISRAERAQSTTLSFISKSKGAMIVFDFRTYMGCAHKHAMNLMPSLTIRLSANFRRGACDEFRAKYFKRWSYTARPRLAFSTFMEAGSVVSKPIPSLVDGEVGTEHHTYFNSWEFRTTLDICCENKTTPAYFVSDLKNVLVDLTSMTKPFTKIFMKDWPPTALFPNCDDVYWERFRENLNPDIGQEILSAMRNT